MKRAFLDGLKGLAVAEAETKVKGAGLQCTVLSKGAMRIAQVVANTVFLYVDGGSICSVEMGDVSECE